MQDNRPHVLCEGADIDNVWTFRYLGSLFSQGGWQPGRRREDKNRGRKHGDWKNEEHMGCKVNSAEPEAENL